MKTVKEWHDVRSLKCLTVILFILLRSIGRSQWWRSLRIASCLLPGSHSSLSTSDHTPNLRRHPQNALIPRALRGNLLQLRRNRLCNRRRLRRRCCFSSCCRRNWALQSKRCSLLQQRICCFWPSDSPQLTSTKLDRCPAACRAIIWLLHLTQRIGRDLQMSWKLKEKLIGVLSMMWKRKWY